MVGIFEKYTAEGEKYEQQSWVPRIVALFIIESFPLLK